jgi:hypothetical protein
LLPWGTGEETEAPHFCVGAGALGGELEATRGGEIEVGGVEDDGRGDAAAQGEVGGPEAIGGARGADEE